MKSQVYRQDATHFTSFHYTTVALPHPMIRVKYIRQDSGFSTFLMYYGHKGPKYSEAAIVYSSMGLWFPEENMPAMGTRGPNPSEVTYIGTGSTKYHRVTGRDDQRSGDYFTVSTSWFLNSHILSIETCIQYIY